MAIWRSLRQDLHLNHKGEVISNCLNVRSVSRAIFEGASSSDVLDYHRRSPLLLKLLTGLVAGSRRLGRDAYANLDRFSHGYTSGDSA